MAPLPKHEVICRKAGYDKESHRAQCRLRRNDPTLKELTLVIHPNNRDSYSNKRTKPKLEMILQAFDAIANNSSLEILNIKACFGFLFSHREKDRVMRALSLNTSLKDIRIAMPYWSNSLLDIVMASPNLQFLTIQNDASHRHSIAATITAMAQVLCGHMNLHSLTFEGLQMDSHMAAAFATAFQGNQAIKTLIMRRNSVYATSAVSLVEALPHDHALEVLVFDENHFTDDSLVRIVHQLCHTPLKVLSLADSSGVSEISQEGCTRIIQTLRENDHSLTKLNLFRDSQDSSWHNFIRCEIEKLTWNNRLQVERASWVNQFLEEDDPTQVLIFLALERAKKVDNKQFSRAPNMLFYLIKESPKLIVQAIRDGL